MLENNIAKPFVSSWSSPCLLVKKPDGTFRPCTDLWKVNQVTQYDSFLLPCMEDCVDQVGSAKYVSIFDLLKGYWQVPFPETDSLPKMQIHDCASTLSIAPFDHPLSQQPITKYINKQPEKKQFFLPVYLSYCHFS